jgi:hypothetical protein
MPELRFVTGRPPLAESMRVQHRARRLTRTLSTGLSISHEQLEHRARLPVRRHAASVGRNRNVGARTQGAGAAFTCFICVHHDLDTRRDLFARVAIAGRRSRARACSPPRNTDAATLIGSYEGPRTRVPRCAPLPRRGDDDGSHHQSKRGIAPIPSIETCNRGRGVRGGSERCLTVSTGRNAPGPIG